MATRFGFALNLRDRLPGLGWLSERLVGFSARRSLPQWRRAVFCSNELSLESGNGDARAVVLLTDTFSTYFEPDNVRAALALLAAGGYQVHVPQGDDGWPLCCGRTFLAVGLVDEAKREAQRMIDGLRPYLQRKIPVIGLEPSCLLTLRDEFKALLPGADSDALAGQALLLEEFLVAEDDAGRLSLPLRPSRWRKALLHGHCHQKAFGIMPAVEQALRLVPELEVDVIEAGCCGMAGSFGFAAEHFDLSMKMAEFELLPAVRAAGEDTVIVADGSSCRHQIRDGAQREAMHVAQILSSALTDERA